MARNQNAKQINFIPADDIADELAQCENKTKVINEALRMYFASGPLRLDIIERIQKLEDFQSRFMAYYIRKDNEPHSEFCDCETCRNNRVFAGQRSVPLDPKPQGFEKVLDVIKRSIEQAQRMNAIVTFENPNGYKFKVTGNSDADDEYSRYEAFEEAQGGNSISFTIPNPWGQT
jgi:hypothetical protein